MTHRDGCAVLPSINVLLSSSPRFGGIIHKDNKSTPGPPEQTERLKLGAGANHLRYARVLRSAIRTDNDSFCESNR